MKLQILQPCVMYQGWAPTMAHADRSNCGRTSAPISMRTVQCHGSRLWCRVTMFYFLNHVYYFFLRYLATGDSYRTIAFSYRVGYITVAVIVREVAGAIWTALVEETMPVPQMEDWRAIAAEFQERWNFPNCVGAIDGKHVVIQALANSGSLPLLQL